MAFLVFRWLNRFFSTPGHRLGTSLCSYSPRGCSNGSQLEGSRPQVGREQEILLKKRDEICCSSAWAYLQGNGVVLALTLDRNVDEGAAAVLAERGRHRREADAQRRHGRRVRRHRRRAAVLAVRRVGRRRIGRRPAAAASSSSSSTTCCYSSSSSAGGGGTDPGTATARRRRGQAVAGFPQTGTQSRRFHAQRLFQEKKIHYFPS